MKIHSTQNLNLNKDQQLSSLSGYRNRDFRLKNYSEQVRQGRESGMLEGYSMSPTFKRVGIKDGKKIINSTKKVVGNIVKEASPEVKRGDNFLDSPFFDGLLNVVDFETVVTATVAAIACAGRGGIILALPTKKNKEDNKYAAGQSWASGIMGFITAFLLTAPFKHGHSYVMKNLKKELNVKTLQRLYPHLDINSIEKNGKRIDIKDWKDIYKHAFSDDIKGCEKLPELKNLSDVSDKTFKNILKVDVDWASQKGKSFNDVQLKNGKKLYDEIDMSRLGIKVSEKEIGNTQILLKDIDKSYLEGLVKDAKTEKSSWGKLDVSTVYDKDGKVIDFRNWKDIEGKQWKLDLDEIGVSSAYETASYKPRVSGYKRYDKKEKVYKFASYQKNGVNGELGTMINEKKIDADSKNEGLFKFLTWLPDLVFRIPVAALTVALIPWTLKSVFHLQKSQKEQKQTTNNTINPTLEKNKETSKDEKLSFKGKNSLTSKFSDWLGKSIGEIYGKPLIENEFFYKLSSTFADLPGNVTQHMSTLGSLITSGTYVNRTLQKKDIEPDRRRTLAVNQALCFLIPTIAAYTVNIALNNWIKNNEYRYVGLKERKIDIAKLEKQDAKKIAKEIETLSKKTKGIRTLASIAIFTMIYRFATPILMTPIANKIGDKWNEKRRAKLKNTEKEQQLNNIDKPLAKTIEMDNSNLDSSKEKSHKVA